MRREALKLMVGGLALLTAAGCGFQLRGAHAIPYRSVYVDAPKGSQIARLMNDALQERGLAIADSAKSADAVLKLSKENKGLTILSLSGSGRVREYRLNYSLVYSLTGRDGQGIYPESAFQASHDFTYDDNLYLAKTAEENFLYRDLQKDAVQLILRRLASASSSQ